MKFNCVLQRIAEFEDVRKVPFYDLEPSTIGEFKVFDESGREIFTSFCVENGGESTDTPQRDKRIVAREYFLKWSKTTISIPKKYRDSKRVPKEELLGCGLLLWTPKMPSFEKRRVLIHIGNYPQDTEGCLLLCKYWNGKSGYANNSRLAVEEFYDLVAKEGVENFSLVIKEIGE